MSDLSDIRDGIKTVLEAANPSLRVYAYEPDGPLDYPCLVIEDTPEIDYDVAIGGNSLSLEEYTATLLVFSSSRVEARQEMDKYMSPTGTESIRAGIQSDRKLDGKVDDAYMKRCAPVLRDDEDEESRIWQAEFTILIMKTIA